ncbi:unnamed protein product [Brachionus calyciflorus]|uniref:ascorbate ferrireductase (transmembrane) n=1 Tax=Brachionus calyciflorus TaxID=104777 RepID=A0A813N6Z4_9BILA|nr:unnamed protein product [Brachionus calyciflorus]
MPDDRQKAHACLMIIAWMIFVPIAIVVARYMRFLFPTKKLCGSSVWLAVHRTLMLLVPVLSIAAFIVILANLNWDWVKPSKTLHFIHSIFGIFAIFLSFFQVMLAYIRPRFTESARNIFVLIHRWVGILALISATVAIFLGVCMPEMRLGTVGWGTMIGYVVYLILIPIPFELVYYFFYTKNGGVMSDRRKFWYEILSHLFYTIHTTAVMTFAINIIVLIAVGIETFGFKV